MNKDPKPTSFHLDSDSRIDDERHSGIVIQAHKLLLMHRIRAGNEYFPLPGGHARQGETGEQAVIRELAEETSIIVANPRLILQFFDPEHDQTDFVYECEFVSGSPELGGEEALKQAKDNFYEPLWIDLDKIGELPLVPIFVKTWLAKNLDHLKSQY